MVPAHQALQVLDFKDRLARQLGRALQWALPEVQLRGSEERANNRDDSHCGLRVAT
jgi:hypothetical protein